MRFLALGGFAIFTLLKIRVIGVHGAGALTVAQIGLAELLYVLRERRATAKDPLYIWIDENNVVQWRSKDGSSPPIRL